jgi:tripartite ATP-independent transporter DctM subunit
MEWWVGLIFLSGLIIAVFLTGLPVAFGFLFVNIVAALIWMGGINALPLLFSSIIGNVAVFGLVAIPLFILLGELMFQTGLVTLLVDAAGKWIGGIRGSLSFVAIIAGTLFAMMSGSAISGVALLGSTLVPEMRRQGYAKEMSIGPVLGAGGLAMIIPPSILAVILATIAQISVGAVLIAGIIPGVVLAGSQAVYIAIRLTLQPHLCAKFAPPEVTWRERFKSLAFALPLGILILLVLGLIFMGVATPSEAAASGALGAFVLSIVYRRLNWRAFKGSISETVSLSTMVFMILIGSMTFSNVLSYTGVSQALTKAATTAPVHPLLIVVLMMIVLVFLGMLMDAVSMMMITIPIYFPVINALGFDPIWFSILMLVNLDVGTITPPFGICLFTIKGVVPDSSMRDIIMAAVPFVLLEMFCIALVMLVPGLATWLPSLALL